LFAARKAADSRHPLVVFSPKTIDAEQLTNESCIMIAYKHINRPSNILAIFILENISENAAGKHQDLESWLLSLLLLQIFLASCVSHTNLKARTLILILLVDEVGGFDTYIV
jgi:hypothetical protein